jgi:hypothetical protein
MPARVLSVTTATRRRSEETATRVVIVYGKTNARMLAEGMGAATIVVMEAGRFPAADEGHEVAEAVKIAAGAAVETLAMDRAAAVAAVGVVVGLSEAEEMAGSAEGSEVGAAAVEQEAREGAGEAKDEAGEAKDEAEEAKDEAEE